MHMDRICGAAISGMMICDSGYGRIKVSSRFV